MSAIAPKPEGTGLSCQLRGRSAVAPLARGACHGRRIASVDKYGISSRKASVAATRGLFRGSLKGYQLPHEVDEHSTVSPSVLQASVRGARFSARAARVNH